MLCRNAKPDRPILAAEPGDHGMVGQHRLVPAGTGHLDVTPVSGEVVKGPNLSRAHRLHWNDARTSCKRVSDLKLKLTLNSNLRVNRRQLGKVAGAPEQPVQRNPTFLALPPLNSPKRMATSASLGPTDEAERGRRDRGWIRIRAWACLVEYKTGICGYRPMRIGTYE